MPKVFKRNLFKICKILSLTLLFSSAASSAFAEESDYHNFPTGEQEGGGVRGTAVSCNNDVSYPVPLIPQDSHTLTASASPKLFFDTSNVRQTTSLDFVLLNKDDKIVRQDILITDKTSGLVSLDLSDRYNSNELKINDAYRWYLVQQCEDFAEPNIVANGSLQRIKLEDELAKKISIASTRDKISIYQEANIWHEALEHLTQLKCDPSNVKAIDKQLLQITNVANLSAERLDSSLDNYCAANLETESIVMK